jgi:CheY-like chemotaxis protein
MFKLLLIDDDAFANEMVVMLLEKAGIKSDFRTSGADALNYLNDCKTINSFPDVMLVDINMPGMDGFTFIKHYEERFRKKSPNTKIFVLTNSMLRKERDKINNYNSVVELWNKPLTMNKISELVECHLQKDF